MKKLTVFLTFSLFLALNLTAQSKQAKARFMKWGKVEPEYLSMTAYTPDTSAAAVILGRQGRIYMETSAGEFQIRYEYHERTKLLKESAFEDIGKVEVYASTTNSIERIETLKAMVIQPDGTVYNLKKEDFFEEKTTKGRKRKKIIFPNLKVGTIVEYYYEKVADFSYYAASLYPWFFQSEYPVLKSDLELTIPETFDYIYLFKGETKLKSFDNVLVSTNYGIQANLLHYYVDSVSAFKPEGYVTTYIDYVTSIRFQLRQINYRDGRIEPFLSTWYKLAENWYNREDIGKQVSVHGKHNKIWAAVEPLLVNAKTDEEKVKIIYNYLSKNVVWDEDFDNSTNYNSIDEAFEKKTANSGELNLMLLACLDELGIKALPCLVSTREHGQPITTYPIWWQFDHVLAYVELEGKPTFIDVGNQYRPYNLPRAASLNKEGWLLEKNNPRWVTLPALMSSSTVLANFTLDTEGGVSGAVSTSYGGHAGAAARNLHFTDTDNKKLKEKMVKKLGDFELEKVEAQNADDVMQPFKQTITVKIPNVATVSDGIMYLKPTFNGEFDENPFKLADRTYPIDFESPIKDQYILNLTFPEGYMIEEMPKSLSLSLPDNAGKLQYMSSLKGNTLQLVLKLNINTLHFDAEMYPALREFFSQVALKQTEQIVLKKKN